MPGIKKCNITFRFSLKYCLSSVAWSCWRFVWLLAWKSSNAREDLAKKTSVTYHLMYVGLRMLRVPAFRSKVSASCKLPLFRRTATPQGCCLEELDTLLRRAANASLLAGDQRRYLTRYVFAKTFSCSRIQAYVKCPKFFLLLSLGNELDILWFFSWAQ